VKEQFCDQDINTTKEIFGLWLGFLRNIRKLGLDTTNVTNPSCWQIK
jgi:hypothetical protein